MQMNYVDLIFFVFSDSVYFTQAQKNKVHCVILSDCSVCILLEAEHHKHRAFAHLTSLHARRPIMIL